MQRTVPPAAEGTRAQFVTVMGNAATGVTGLAETRPIGVRAKVIRLDQHSEKEIISESGPQCSEAMSRWSPGRAFIRSPAV